MKKCQAVKSITDLRECGAPAYWVATYERTCTCWPETKTFCANHGPRVLADWAPPFEKGVCGECRSLIGLMRMEVIRT